MKQKGGLLVATRLKSEISLGWNHGSGKPATAAVTVIGTFLEWGTDKAYWLRGGDLMEWLLVLEGCHDRAPRTVDTKQDGVWAV